MNSHHTMKWTTFVPIQPRHRCVPSIFPTDKPNDIYKSHGQVLLWICDYPVYLGVTLDRTLSFKTHVEKDKEQPGIIIKAVGIQGELPEEHQSSDNTLKGNESIAIWGERCSSSMPATSMLLKPSEEWPTGSVYRGTEWKCLNHLRTSVNCSKEFLQKSGFLIDNSDLKYECGTEPQTMQHLLGWMSSIGAYL